MARSSPGQCFLGVIGFLLLGFPVAFTLAGTSILFAFAGLYFGVFDMSNLRSLAGRYTGYMLNEVLVAVPLFIFMGGDAGTQQYRGTVAIHHGAAVRRHARRAWNFGHPCGRAVGGQHRRCGRKPWSRWG